MQDVTGNTPHATLRAVPASILTTQPMQPVRADQSSAALNAGGCISDISSDSIHGCEHDYAAAMKSFGVVYEQYQSYLMPRNQLMPHDYDVAANPVPAFSHLGCLNAELLESTVHSDDISDDDIEDCGYLGWLHH